MVRIDNNQDAISIRIRMVANMLMANQTEIIEQALPAWAKVANDRISSETVAGTVSRKGSRWGWTCDECGWIWYPPEDTLEHTICGDSNVYDKDALVADGWKKFPNKRCKTCRSSMKRWQTARRVFVELDELRMNEEVEYLRFVTLTRREWNIIVPDSGLPLPESDSEPTSLTIQKEKQKLKKLATKQFRNWRFRNEWWKSRNAMGQFWPECVETPQKDGSVKLHFHFHMVLVSKYLDNRIRKGTKYPDDSRFQGEWGGIVDVRAVKDYQVKYQVKGETRKGCGRKACMKYLSKYISKAKGWRSQPIGKWKYGIRESLQPGTGTPAMIPLLERIGRELMN